MASASRPQHQRKKEQELAFGPFGFLNPTIRRYPLSWKLPVREQERQSDGDGGEEEGPKDGEEGQGSGNGGQTKKDVIRAEEVQREYRTRDNRKGRHAIFVIPEIAANAKYLTPPATNTLRATIHGILRMFTWAPYWDVSYLVAVVFTFGSMVWCINAFFVWLPLQDPGTEFEGEITTAGGITAFIGATIFEFGSVLLMLEAVNENTADCFGWALEEVLEENGLIRVKPDGCTHHHKNRKNLIGKGQAPEGATIFWISGFTALPPIFDRLTSTAAQNGAYWLPQVIGGTGFIISGTLFMLETQEKWYLPATGVLGWHIGAWNLIGGIGFTLCGALGFASSNSGCVYQGSLATFWGSWCFLIGSVIQWYESLDKHPVHVDDEVESESTS
ncbi:hypothetical protein G7Y89_g12774 [Cudoniella acicularis]|uniref:Integral membrane protein n=1 Tax=Cudoniella acicularis TaxID=354080 RepID=A0A8H4VX19_9HELO|nr:hypothetical protein G7Y89_g12774 [Cudoniella acicularis]